MTEATTSVEPDEIEMVEDDGIDPIDVSRGDDAYDDLNEGADVEEVPVPSVYGAEDVLDGREPGKGDS